MRLDAATLGIDIEISDLIATELAKMFTVDPSRQRSELQRLVTKTVKRPSRRGLKRSARRWGPKIKKAIMALFRIPGSPIALPGLRYKIKLLFFNQCNAGLDH
jgi:hypothetical protein